MCVELSNYAFDYFKKLSQTPSPKKQKQQLIIIIIIKILKFDLSICYQTKIGEQETIEKFLFNVYLRVICRQQGFSLPITSSGINGNNQSIRKFYSTSVTV